jgi:hypothetical protein
MFLFLLVFLSAVCIRRGFDEKIPHEAVQNTGEQFFGGVVDTSEKS